jgi:hypothetical protein
MSGFGPTLEDAHRAIRLQDDGIHVGKIPGSGEVLLALRSSGAGDLADVDAVVLETDGSMSVLKSRYGTLPRLGGHARCPAFRPSCQLRDHDVTLANVGE